MLEVYIFYLPKWQGTAVSYFYEKNMNVIMNIRLEADLLCVGSLSHDLLT